MTTLTDAAAISDSILETEGTADFYYTFKPRPDNPKMFDQQTSFVKSKCPGTAWLLGGNGSGTTETVMHKVSQFVMNTRPHRS